MEEKNEIYINNIEEATVEVRKLIEKYPQRITGLRALADEIGISLNTLNCIVKAKQVTLSFLVRLKLSNFLRKVESGDW